MKKNDILLVGAILLIAAVLFFAVQYKRNSKEADWVVVSNGSTEYARYPLHKDGTYEIVAHEGEKNVLTIKDGVVNMIEANCSDQICVYQKEISKNGEMIVCLPHQIIVEIESGEESTSDAVAN